MIRAGWILAAVAMIAVASVAGFFLGRNTLQCPDAGGRAGNVASAVAPRAPAPAQPASAPAAAKPGPAAGPALVQGRPEHVGECATSNVMWVGTRLEDENDRPIADSGSAIQLRNGVYGVSYDQIPAVDASRVGDPVRTCLVSIPKDCPPGDDRGREYHTTNQRTGQEWTLPDAQHMCGGA